MDAEEEEDDAEDENEEDEEQDYIPLPDEVDDYLHNPNFSPKPSRSSASTSGASSPPQEALSEQKRNSATTQLHSRFSTLLARFGLGRRRSPAFSAAVAPHEPQGRWTFSIFPYGDFTTTLLSHIYTQSPTP